MNATTTQKLWYAIQVETGKEDRVRLDLRKKVRIESLEHLVGEIVLPRHKVREYRSGKSLDMMRKATPGYLLVEMVFNETTHLLLRTQRFVMKLLPSFESPVPVKDKEMAEILARDHPGAAVADVAYKLSYNVGDDVQILDGAFKGFESKVLEIDEDLGKEPTVKVEVVLFGRNVPVELPALQVRKVK